jgi:hypothetical protein
VDNPIEPEVSNAPEENSCINCGSPDIVDGHRNKLCAPCRQKFIKFPIPLWVKLFGAGIAVIMVISLIWLPRNIKAAVYLSRAEKAEAGLNYVTEQKELEKAKALVPGSLDIQSHLAIAAFYNEDLPAIIEADKIISTRNFEDTALLRKVENVMNGLRDYFPSDTFTNVLGRYKNKAIPDTAYQHYLKKFPMDIYATYSLAASYLNQEKYAPVDTLLSKALSIDPGFIVAMDLKTMVKRELNQPDSSIYYSDKLLAINHQALYAMSSKARTLLKTRKNKEGLQLALDCYKIDKNMAYNTATLAIGYHFNNDFKNRDAIIRSAKDSLTIAYLEYAKDIISNKVKFQN